MNKIIQIKVFNDVLDQFFEYIEYEFKYFRSDIILTKSSIDLIRKSNPRLVVEQFLKYISKLSFDIYSPPTNSFFNSSWISPIQSLKKLLKI